MLLPTVSHDGDIFWGTAPKGLEDLGLGFGIDSDRDSKVLTSATTPHDPTKILLNFHETLQNLQKVPARPWYTR